MKPVNTTSSAPTQRINLGQPPLGRTVRSLPARLSAGSRRTRCDGLYAERDLTTLEARRS